MSHVRSDPFTEYSPEMLPCWVLLSGRCPVRPFGYGDMLGPWPGFDGRIFPAGLSVQCLKKPDGTVDCLLVLVQEKNDRKPNGPG